MKINDETIKNALDSVAYIKTSSLSEEEQAKKKKKSQNKRVVVGMLLFGV